MLLVIDHPDRDKCNCCASRLEKAGFVVADDGGVRRFLCASHLVELLHSLLIPVRGIRTEA
jgi:hypothetical protein